MVTPDDSKYKNFVFTWIENDDKVLPAQQELLQFLHENFDDYAFQQEVGELTHKNHYQGVMRTRYRMRKHTVLKRFKSAFPEELVKYLTVAEMMGKWEESLAYCTKSETSVGPVFVSPKISTYQGADLQLFTDITKWHPWQLDIKNMLYETFPMMHRKAPGRQVMWLQDIIGASGKSKFTKYVCFKDAFAAKCPFGTANQMRSSLIAAGAQKIYFIDIPRTLGRDDDLDAVISVIEDLKNGFVTSAMYGKTSTLMMDTPHVVIFSNGACPLSKLSGDRWLNYFIDQDTFNLRKI